MKAIYRVIGILLTCSAIISCYTSCSGREVVLTLQNQSSDTIFFEWFITDAKKVYYPEYYLQMLAPNKDNNLQLETLDIESKNMMAWVVRKSMVDKFSMDSVLINRMYDTVYTYSYRELEALNFTTKVRTEDLYKNNGKE